ncbi:unnamed protein product [Chilo suppressalis]|uniref:Molybdenum cofactor sulfurase n=1 Tax=Chilo suppressalis TaxID=168631 RepID=A0ABN8BE95_CHISP|nr:unnamed protein product [Chilo suppressalis]
MATLSNVIEYEQMQKILSEFTRLEDQCYLDNAGSSLYPQHLLHCVTKDLLSNVYMNPHSDKYTKDCVDQIRTSILRFFNTDSSDYSVIFTSGTTQSLKLLVESFQFSYDEQNCGSFVYLRDNHTSVLGLRELAAEKDVDIIHLNHDDFLKALNAHHVTSVTARTRKNKNDANTLLVYPAQSNFNGFKYPINCIEKIKEGCLDSFIKQHLCKIDCNWYVLLDAASYLSTNKLDLSKYQPDFVALSFYKIFGYPTGLGALLVKNSSADVLTEKRYFGGGTVDIVLSNEDYHVKRELFHERFEDGTLPFLSIIALKHCFDVLHQLIPKMVNNDVMDTISYHTYNLAKDLYLQLDKLYHKNGNKAVVFYTDSEFNDISKQGAIVTFNLIRENGSYIGYSEFQHISDLFRISVRTGCFCNSGSCQRHLNTTNKEMKDMYKAGHKCGDEIDLVNGRPTGAIRVSFGYYNTYKDVDKLILMISQCFVPTKLKKQNCVKHQLIRFSRKNCLKEEETQLLNEQQYFNKINFIEENTFDAEISLAEMSIFPIKSCGAFKIKSSWKIGPKGFEYDREWMIVKDNGVCLTQKQNTQMCLIKPKIDLKHRILSLNCIGMPSLSLPLDMTDSKKTNTSFCQSKVCTDIIQGYDCGEEAADWVSNVLGVSFLRLVRQSNEVNRLQKKKKDDTGSKLLSLSNQAQFLLVNKATVRWLSENIKDPQFTDNLQQLADRFRGNIVIDMEQELVEREWQRVIIGKHEFKVEGLCSRCQMICIDQNTGEKTVEPLRTISEQFAGKLRFGIYLSYIGTVGGSEDRMLKLKSSVKPVTNDDDISR